jgi:hypothetical protein
MNGNGNGDEGNNNVAGLGFAGRTVDVGRRSGREGGGDDDREEESRRARRESGYEDEYVEA